MISAAELASLRRESEKFLPDSCVIQRVTYTRETDGGQTEAWTDLATVACRVAPSGYQASEPVVADRPVQQATYIVTLPAETDVTARDRISWSGRTFQVVSVVPRSWEIVRRVYVSEEV